MTLLQLAHRQLNILRLWVLGRTRLPLFPRSAHELDIRACILSILIYELFDRVIWHMTSGGLGSTNLLVLELVGRLERIRAELRERIV